LYKKALHFKDKRRAAIILRTTNTEKMRMTARQIKGYNKSTWRKVCVDIMLAALQAKFGQCKELSARLLKTGDALLAESTPHSRYWGIGWHSSSYHAQDRSSWRGYNMLGCMLMKVRNELKCIS